MALRGGSLELLRGCAKAFLEEGSFKFSNEHTVDFNFQAAASGGCPIAAWPDSGPSSACGLGSSRSASEPKDPGLMAVEPPRIHVGAVPNPLEAAAKLLWIRSRAGKTTL